VGGTAGIGVCDGAIVCYGATLGSGGAVAADSGVVEGAIGVVSVGTTVESGAAGASLVRVRPQCAGKGTSDHCRNWRRRRNYWGV
jgi:hypothetical protein